MASLEKMNVDEAMDILADEVRKIRAEETTPQAVQAVSNALGKWFTGLKLKMVYAQMVGVTPDIEAMNLKQIKSENRGK